MLTEKFPHSPVSGSRRLTSNFTLIELLVVIAMITTT